jgi:carboxylesterase type B
VRSGKYTKVPFIVGDQEDEGTLFALFTPNLTTKAEVSNYFSTVFFDKATTSQIDTLVGTYQDTIEDGSPFRTGLLNNLYPQFKRVAAILGDITFTLTRRVFLETASAVNPSVSSWSYLSTYDYGTPILGTFHASDILQVFYGVVPNNAAKTVRGYYYSFVHNLDPNQGNDFDEWPQWSKGKKLMNFGAQANKLIDDSFRSDTAEWLKNNVGSLRV